MRPTPSSIRLRGFMLLFMMLSVIGLSAIILLGGLGEKLDALARSQDKAAATGQNQNLDKQIKAALLAWATMPGGSLPGQATALLGQLPYPDVLVPGVESPVNYDGQSNNGCLSTAGGALITAGTTIRCLGRLPWRTLGIALDTPTEVDTAGSMPWYAVSANLVSSSCASFQLNPATLNMVYVDGQCNATNLPYPWLTVRDALGNVLSNRVAAVVIYPGPPLSNQVRSSSPLGSASAYLDTLTVQPGCRQPCVPGTYSNASLTPGNSFIQGLDGSQVAANDPNYAHPYAFNDRLIYITIDDLMAALEKRAALEARKRLQVFFDTNHFFPFAAKLGDASNACLRNWGSDSTMHFHDHDHGYGINHDHNGQNPAHEHSHDNTRGALPLAQGSCGAGNYLGGNPASSALPPWFTSSNWQRFLYYTLAPACVPGTSSDHINYSGGNNGNTKIVGNANNTGSATNNPDPTNCNNAAPNNTYLTVGQDTHVKALLITTGRPITSVNGQMPAMTTPPYAYKGSNQTGYPSNSAYDYLDSAVNVNGATAFSAAQGRDRYDAVGTPRNATYNDQMFIVAR